MHWEPARSPASPDHSARTEIVDNALLSRSARGRLHLTPSPGLPRSWMSGAAYDERGRVVEASIRRWDGDGAAPVAVDPIKVAVPARAARLFGDWRYAGTWTSHFGHFFVEALTTLWGPVTPDAGLVFHRTTRPRGGHIGPAGADATRIPDLQPWQQEFLDLAGYPGREVRIVMGKPVRVDRLVVPSRPLLLKSWAAPEAADVWARVSNAVVERGNDAKVFLSRSRFHRAAEARHERSRRSELEWDRFLDEYFARNGFAVMHPELLPLRQQIATIRGAMVIAGASGSALHLSAFARPGTKVLEIGDQRSPTTPMPTQRMIDSACGHWSAFVPYQASTLLKAKVASID